MSYVKEQLSDPVKTVQYLHEIKDKVGVVGLLAPPPSQHASLFYRVC